ncbi:MAG: hypothetical protein C0P77_009965 [Thermoanaerobacterales bacterium]|jgi:hypothetical protein|nr:hypothetical protein [Thermoanaerobacterales bacterium]
MRIRRRIARALAAVGLATAGIAGSVVTASPASAEPTIPIDWNVDATAHIASLGIDNTMTGGRFTGSVDLGDSTITGDLTLPASETTLEVLGVGLADVGIQVAPTGPVTGSVDLSTLTVELTSSFDIKITHLNPFGVDWINLVGRKCQTREPVTLTMSGPIDLVGGSTFSGEFTIPKFKDCGLLTLPLNLLLPGGGNTFTATASPPPAA